MSDDRVLTLALRPKGLDDLVGQSKNVEAIKNQIASGRIPRAWMFEGPPGGGKTTLARILALSFQLPKERFGAPTDADWAESMREGQWIKYDIVEINASETNGVEDIKSIAKTSVYLPSPGSKKRVFIMDEAQRLTRDAQNLLLKYTEDPPKGTVWMFCTTDPGKILPALKSRCKAAYYRVRPLGTEAMTKLIKRAMKAAGQTKPIEPLVEAFDLCGVTSPREIVAAVESYLAGKTAQAAVISGESEINTGRICKAFIRGDWPCIRGEMKGATGDEARAARLGVLGYLRAILLSPSGSSIPATRLADSIVALTNSNGPFEDSAYAAWVTAILFQECRKYKS